MFIHTTLKAYPHVCLKKFIDSKPSTFPQDYHYKVTIVDGRSLSIGITKLRSMHQIGEENPILTNVTNTTFITVIALEREPYSMSKISINSVNSGTPETRRD